MTSWKLKEGPVTLEDDAAPPQGTAAKAGPATFQHLFEPREVHAVNAALAAGRPLLVRGEAGVGKSQLARAAAKGLGRRFVATTVDARTESQDLLWTFDAVRRLADAQLLGSGLLRGEEAGKEKQKGLSTEAQLDETRKLLDEGKYLGPGPLWWGFSWESAVKQRKRSGAPFPAGFEDVDDAPQGVVVLIDEIDKADSSVPNGLLECLGNRQFTSPTGDVVCCDAVPPLVVVTTNEERSLPDAFLRRCLVLQMKVPEGDELRKWLLKRGRAHFDEDALETELLESAAWLLAEDRAAAQRQGLAPPGGAEYLDLLRALYHLGETPKERRGLLDEIRGFTFRKHPREDLGS